MARHRVNALDALPEQHHLGVREDVEGCREGLVADRGERLGPAAHEGRQIPGLRKVGGGHRPAPS